MNPDDSRPFGRRPRLARVPVRDRHVAGQHAPRRQGICRQPTIAAVEDRAFSVIALLREHLALATPIGQQDRRVCDAMPDRRFGPPTPPPPRLFPATTLQGILLFPLS